MAVAVGEYALDPKEVGIELNKPGQPTPKGWEIVTPQLWYFRTKQLSDKQITIDGYKDPETWLDCTRALVTVDVEEENPSASPIMISALVTKKIVERWPAKIRPNEVLAGMACSDEKALIYDPFEHPAYLLEDHYNEGKCGTWDYEKGQRVPLTEEEYKKLLKFLKRYNHLEKLRTLLPEKIFNMYYHPNFIRYWEPVGSPGRRAAIDLPWIMEKGCRGIIEEIDKTMARLEKEFYDPATDARKAPKLGERIDAMKAARIGVEGIQGWYRAYRDEARRQLQTEKDEWQQKRLQRIADGCDWLIENPARNLFEACQAFEIWWHVSQHHELSGHTFSCRPDQLFYPYYKKEVLEEKTLSRREAADIIAALLLKMCEYGIQCSHRVGRGYLQGVRDAATPVLGGVNPDGSQAFNELSDLLLDIVDGYRLHYPDFKFRWNKNVRKEHLRRAVEIMRSGMGMPSFKNDEIAIAAMMSNYPGNITLEEARSYGIMGCITPCPTINGYVDLIRAATFIPINKWLEMTIFNGRDPEPGFEWVDIREEIGDCDVRNCKDFEAFYQRFLDVFRWAHHMDVRIRNMVFHHLSEVAMRPIKTAAVRRCVQGGYDDYSVPGMPKFSFWNTTGLVDTVDSLTAVKYCIYDKKMYTWDQLIEALKAEWKGYEDMQRDFKNAPKYGNDDDYADSVMVRFVNDLNAISHEPGGRDQDGGPVVPSGLIITSMFVCAPWTGALPNGRKRGEYLADGTLCPYAEFDKSGPWARSRSAQKIDQTKFKAWINNMKIEYPSVEGDAGLEKLVDFVDANMRGGNEQLQINFMSRDILRDAQEHPEKYPFLSVRISGWSAYFTALPKGMQDAVISRVDFKL